MPKNVHPAVDGLEAAFREGTARIEEVTPEGTLASDEEMARRCQHCGEPVQRETAHTWAVVEVDRSPGDLEVHRPVFCDPTCLHVWSVAVDESHTGNV